jgi:hypothetical protein
MNNHETSELISETENLLVWRSKEELGYLYHLELGHISLHLMSEEWEELFELIMGARDD